MVDAKGPNAGGVRPARGRKYEKKRFRKSDIVLRRKGLIPIHASLKEGAMKRICLLLAALLITAGTASATATVQKWTAGWDDFSEPLNYTTSKVSWSVNTTTRNLSVTFTLRGATPSKLYQVGAHIFCTTIASTFGQFPTEVASRPTCNTATRQGVTRSIAGVEFGVVTTDIHGNGIFSVAVGPIASGTYHLEFTTRNGAGCDLTGGGNPTDPNICNADFQSPGPIFGDATTIIIP